MKGLKAFTLMPQKDVDKEYCRQDDDESKNENLQMRI